MERVREGTERIFRKITGRRQRQSDIPPAVPSAIITPESPSATGGQRVQQNVSSATCPISPVAPSASIPPEESSPIPPEGLSTSIRLEDPSAAGSDYIQQEQSRDSLPAEKSLWDRAYNALAKENPDLVGKYDKLLAEEEPMANTSPSETRPLQLPTPNNVDTYADCSPRQAQLKTVIQKGLRRMEDNKTKFKIAGREIDLEDKITKAANILVWGKEFIGNAIKDSPEASLVWAGVSLIIPLFTNPATAAEANRDGFSYVTSRMDYYVALEPMVHQLGQSARVDEALVTAANNHIVDLYQAILDFQLSSVLRFYQSRFKVYINDTVTSKDWEETLLGIKTREETVNSALGQISGLEARERLELLNKTSEETRAIMEDCLSVATEQLAVAKKQLTVTEKQLAAQEDEKRERLLAEQQVQLEKLLAEQHKCLQLFCLSRNDTDAMYDWYKDGVEDRVEGTCKWFLQHEYFQKWLSQRLGPLLVSADPGCGKSVLAKYMVDHGLAQQSATICYFFFRDKDQNTTRQALCALLHQLFSQKRALIRHTMELYNDMGARLVQSEPSLWSILRAAVRDPQAGLVIFVIDALDECDESQLSSLITNLEDMFGDQQLADAKFKVLMTSRPYLRVVNKFSSFQDVFPRIHIPGEEESEAISQEINSVIQHRVRQLARTHRLSGKIESSLNSKLLAINHRTYLWVYLVFNYLDEGFNDGFKKTQAGITSAIKELPESVNQAYDQILNRSRKDKTVKTVKRALSIILAARRPLTLSEMNIAMNLDDQGRGRSIYDLDLDQDVDIKSRLRTLCGLFVNVYHDRVYFLHQTAREFLIQSSSPATVSSNLQWHHSITTRYAHSVLAEICILYLDRLNSTQAETFREDGHHGALSEYSVENWGDHCREAGFENGAMVDLASRLCTPDWTSNSQWVSIFSKRYHISSGSSTNALVASRLGLTPVTELLLSRGVDIEAKDSQGRTALICAAMSGHDAVTRLLLDKGADIEAKNINGYTALMRAARYGHEAVTQLLLDGGADVEAKNHNGSTALMFAANPVMLDAKASNAVFTRLLSDIGTDVEAKHNDGPTALVYGAISSPEVLTQLMLDNGYDVEAEESRGWPTLVRVGQYLMLASESGPEAVTRLLLEKGADVEAKDNNGLTPLMLAAASGHEAVTRLLLDKGANIETKNNNGLTALIPAAANGHEAVTRLLLETGAAVESKDNNGLTALMPAARYGHETVTRLLLENGAKVEAKDNSGLTALMLAAAHGHEAVTQLLIDECADIEAKSNNGLTALIPAAAHGHEAVTRLLLDKGADIEAKDSDGWTALMLAANSGHEAVTQLLLDKGADIETKNNDGFTALMSASAFGHEITTRLLLENGADVEAKNNNGLTALMPAAANGHEAVTQLLLDAGTDIEAKDNNGWTTLMLAAASGHEAVTRLLLDKGADIEAKNNNGLTAIIPTAAHGHEAVMRLLLDSGADVEAKNNDGWTVLMTASIKGHRSITWLLLEHGADVEAKNKNGLTALIPAAANGHEAVTQLLLDGGADVEAKDNNGLTALMIAAGNGREAVTRLLLDKGADVVAKSNNAWTALTFAVENGHEAVTRLLLDNGANVEANDVQV